MSVTVEIANTENLSRLREILGVKDDSEAIETLIERTLRTLELKEPNDELAKQPVESASHDLPDEYWEELFAEPEIPSEVIDRILRDEREDRF
ncbi:MAG: hypothetical protein IT173_13075 [Acidobacteria bacterium]|nr:hypothetical protein [Acidobacteriota bacterium]